MSDDVDEGLPAKVISLHIRDADRGLAMALHFTRYCPSQASAAIAHARKAGEFAAYSGLPYLSWFKHQALTIEGIRNEFVESWFATRELLADEPLSS